MTEEEAQVWLAERYAAGQIARLEAFVSLLRTEAEKQSLVARSTFASIWARHIVDSAQLIPLASLEGNWLDVGSGGGLPGLVVAILRDSPIVMSEPRRKRADFLTAMISELDLSNASVQACRAQNVTGDFAIVSARAVAPIEDILHWTRAIVSRGTQYILHRGRNWQEDVALARRAWHGAFHVEQSITDPDAGIIIARDATPR